MLTGSPQQPSLLEAPQQYARLEGTSMPSESEEVPPQSTDLTIREPPTDSSIYNNALTNYYPTKPKKSALLDDGSEFNQITTERAPSIPAPPKQPLIRDEWASYENPLPFTNEDIPIDTSTFEDITRPRLQAPAKGGRKGASMRRKEEWNALPDGTQLELTYNKSNRIYTKQGDGVVDAEGNQYKSLNDAVRKYKASIGDTKQFGSAYTMFKII